MAPKSKSKGVMSSKSYFKRARAFGILMLIVGLGIVLYYLLTYFIWG